MRKTVAIMGVPIDCLAMNQVLDRLDQFVQTRRFHQVATANTDFLLKAQHDPELSIILRTADMVVPDGMPVVMASRWLGAALPERVTGADMVPPLAALAERKGYSIFLLGARPDVAKRAHDNLVKDHPNLRIAGCLSPSVAPVAAMDNEEILQQIDDAKPDILLVAFGNPKQEKWIHMHRHRLAVPVCIGVGGTFDFIAGEVARAPHWMQRASLEWTYRLAREPRRLWKRYSNNFVYFPRYLLPQLWAMKTRDLKDDAVITDMRVGDCTVLSVKGSLGSQSLSEFQYKVSKALDAPSHLVLDLQATTSLDCTAIGTLLNLPKRAANVGMDVRLAGMNPGVARILRLSRVNNLFHTYSTVTGALLGEAMSGLQVLFAKEDRAAVFTLKGHADVYSSSNLRHRLAELPKEVSFVDVDLRNLTYIDAAVLEVLHRFSTSMKEAGGQCRLSPGHVVKQSLIREQMASCFNIVDAPRRIAANSQVVKAEG